jgi:hypothetical protein
LFAECYGIAKMVAQEKWENELEENRFDEGWDRKYWEQRGTRYFSQNISKLMLNVDEDANPWEQYKQVIKQAGNGDFSASELKQIMESMNVGTRVYEVFKLQSEVDNMKKDLNEMSQNNGVNIIPITKNS